MAVSPEQKKYRPSRKEEIFDLLSNHRRRYTIHYCKQQGCPVTLSDLAEQVAAWEQGKSVSELTSAERKRVYTSLQQTHLDRLEDAGLIEFDGRTIELTEQAKELDIYLDIVPEQSIPWGVYYLGLSALSLIVLAGLWIGVLQTDAISTLGWMTVIVLVYAVSAVVHTVQNHRYRLDEFDPPI